MESSNNSESSYSFLMDTLWNPSEESVARIRRLQELEEMRKQRQATYRRDPESETAGMSARQRFYHNYQPPASRFTRVSQMPMLANRRSSEPFQRSMSETQMPRNRERTIGTPAYPAWPDRVGDNTDSSYGRPNEDAVSGYQSGMTYTGSAPQRIAYIDDTGKTHWLDPSSPLINLVGRPDPTSPDGRDHSVKRSASFDGSPTAKTAPNPLSPSLLSSTVGDTGESFASKFPMSARLLQSQSQDDNENGHATHFSGSYLGGEAQSDYSGGYLGGSGRSAYSGGYLGGAGYSGGADDSDIPWELKYPSAAKLLLSGGQNQELKTPGLEEAADLDPGFICDDIPLEERFPLAAQILAMKEYEKAQEAKLAATGTENGDRTDSDNVTDAFSQLQTEESNSTKPELNTVTEEEEADPNSQRRKSSSGSQNDTDKPKTTPVKPEGKSPTNKSPTARPKSVSAPKTPPVKQDSKSLTTKSPVVKQNGKSPTTKSPPVKQDGKSPTSKSPPTKQDSVGAPKTPPVKQDSKSPTTKSRAPPPPKSSKPGEDSPPPKTETSAAEKVAVENETTSF